MDSPGTSGIVPALRGGAMDGILPALRGGAMGGIVPALRGGKMFFRNSQALHAFGFALALAAASACKHSAVSQDAGATGVAASGGSAGPQNPFGATGNNNGSGALDGGAAAKDTGGSAGKPASKIWQHCDAGVNENDASVSPYVNACAVDEELGVFVAATRGDDASADGSRDHPFKTLTAAIRLAAQRDKRVYACSGVYEEHVAIGGELGAEDLQLYGGLDCDEFRVDPSGARSVVRAKGKGAALVIADTRAITVARFDFENIAGDAAPRGTTYVGAVVRNAKRIVLDDVRLTASRGEDGKDGAAPPGAAGSGTPGGNGSDACAATPVPGSGGLGDASCAMQSGMFTSTGPGGVGGLGTAAGGDGVWFSSNPGGRGESDSSWSCNTDGGGSGPSYAMSPSVPGQPGQGARGFGALIGNGFVGLSGTPGSIGNFGYAGGGSGGARAPASCAGVSPASGASGGGGGGGGCGGKGGEAGGAGGSSFGLIAIDAELQLLGGRITYADGGRGGNGALGQAGGKGAPGGKGGRGSGSSKNACDGGAGQDGGAGGPGGGGNGGHAIGVLFIGKVPVLTGTAGAMEGAANKGAVGGSGPKVMDAMQQTLLAGSAGLAAFMHEF